MQRGTYSPTTANNILRLIGTITNAAWDEYEIDRRCPGKRLPCLSLRGHVVYTEEEPNAFTIEEMRTFLALLREHWPQHFAMVALGFATGLRPSSLRPLRRTGPHADIKWDEQRSPVRRSHTSGREVMDTTKTGVRYSIPLPTEMIEILRWHVDEQLPADSPMHESELLFPTTHGGFRSTTCLIKPFDDITRRMKLTKHISPRAMRRTFKDLARQAQVHDVVTRAVSGHDTEEMHRHYSTAQTDEIRDGLAKVVSIAGFREALAAGSGMHSA